MRFIASVLTQLNMVHYLLHKITKTLDFILARRRPETISFSARSLNRISLWFIKLHFQASSSLLLMNRPAWLPVTPKERVSCNELQ